MEFFSTSEFRNSASYNNKKSSGMNPRSDSGSLFVQAVTNPPEPSGSLDSITDDDQRDSMARQGKAKDSIRDREPQPLQVDKFGPFPVTETPRDGTHVSNDGNSTSNLSRWSRGFDMPSATTPRLSVDRGSPAKGRKKRSRASKRVPTTVLTTDASNFKAMVQLFTGIATKPFTSSANSSANFSANLSSNPGGIDLSAPELIFPKPFPHAALAARNSSSRCLTTVDVDPSLINPSTCNNNNDDNKNSFAPSLIPPALNPCINPFLQYPDHHNFLMNINRLSPDDQFCIYEEQQQQPMSDYISAGFMEELGLDCARGGLFQIGVDR